VLRRLSPEHVRHLTWPFMRARPGPDGTPRPGWTAEDCLHALDHDQSGRTHGYTTAVRFPAAWAQARLARWLSPDGTPLPSPSQLRRQRHERDRAEQAQRRADRDRAAVAAADAPQWAARARGELSASSEQARGALARAAAPVPSRRPRGAAVPDPRSPAQIRLARAVAEDAGKPLRGAVLARALLAARDPAERQAILDRVAGAWPRRTKTAGDTLQHSGHFRGWRRAITRSILWFAAQEYGKGETMPYLDWNHDLNGTGTPTPAGTWVPERNQQAWEQRGAGLLLRSAWTTEKGPTPQQMTQFDQQPEAVQQQHYKALARDMASAQRDGLFYFNALERLKNDPSDTVADEVIDHLKELGFTSIGLPEAAGGPPPGKSPRPFKKVLDWLIQQIAKVGKFLLNAAAFITARLYDLGLQAVAVQVPWPPQVSIEFAPSVLREPEPWRRVKEFLDEYLDELGKKVFE
jgi:hypothetical protein